MNLKEIATSSFLLLVVMPGAASSFLLLVVRHVAMSLVGMRYFELLCLFSNACVGAMSLVGADDVRHSCCL